MESTQTLNMDWSLWGVIFKTIFSRLIIVFLFHDASFINLIIMQVIKVELVIFFIHIADCFVMLELIERVPFFLIFLLICWVIGDLVLLYSS
jgi:hypothetical protein